MVLVHDWEIIPFGVKHKCDNINDVIKTDPSYCIWLLRQEWLSKHKEIKELLEAHFKPDDIVLWFGTHKKKTLSHIKEKYPNYINFLKTYDYVQNNEKAKELKEAVNKL